MAFRATIERSIGRALTVLGLTAAVTGLVVAVAHADSTPVGPLPAGPVSSTTTLPGQLLAVALPKARQGSGLVWRLARAYDPKVVRQLSEADIDRNVILVFKVVGRGSTALVFALTRGDASPVAVKAITHKIRSA